MRSDRYRAEEPERSPLAILGLTLCLTLLPQPALAAATVGDAIQPILEQMESSYAQIYDYQAIFHKQERVGGRLLPEETILFKFQKPLKIYMKWIGEPLKGTEALYVQGKYDNKLLAHRGGLLGAITLSLDPKGAMAMQGERHPIVEAGFGFIIQQMRLNLDEALRREEFEIVRIGEEDFGGRPATVIEGRFSPGEGRKYYTSHMIVHIDRELRLPVGNVFFDEKEVLFEKYFFTDVRVNIGFSTMDFSRYNEKYGFR